MQSLQLRVVGVVASLLGDCCVKGMMVELVKQVHLQKRVGAAEDGEWLACS